MGMTQDFPIGVEPKARRFCALARRFLASAEQGRAISRLPSAAGKPPLLKRRIRKCDSSRRTSNTSETSWPLPGTTARSRSSNLNCSGARAPVRVAAASRMSSVRFCVRSVSHTDKSFELLGFDMVGGYALQPRWADGHSTGIYSFTYLRRLAQHSN